MASQWFNYSFINEDLSPAVCLDLGSIGSTWGLGKKVVRLEFWSNAYFVSNNVPPNSPGVFNLDYGWSIACYIGELTEGPETEFTTHPANMAYAASFTPGTPVPVDLDNGVWPPPVTDDLGWAQVWTIPQSQTSHLNKDVTVGTTLVVLTDNGAAASTLFVNYQRTWGFVRVLIQDAGG